MFDVAQSPAPDERILSISGDGKMWVANTSGNQTACLVGIHMLAGLHPAVDSKKH
jgi:hypothetical protein